MEGYDVFFSSALQPLYKESSTRNSVQSVLNNINAMFGVSSSSLSLHINSHQNPVNFTYHTGVDENFATYYHNKQNNIDPIANSSTEYAIDNGFTMAELCNKYPNWGEAYKSSFSSFGYKDALLVNFYTQCGGRGVLVLRSDIHRGEFKAIEAHSISQLSPYLRMALQSHLQLYNPVSGIPEICSHSAMAIFHITRSGRLLQANAEGYKILNSADGMSLNNGHLRLIDSISQFHLKEALFDIYRQPQSKTKIIKIQRTQETFFVVRIFPLNQKDSRDNEIMLMLSDPFRAIHSEPALLCELFDLTHREADIAILLGNGDKPADIAIRDDVSINTVKSQRNSIYEKMGIRSQMQLIRLIHSLGILAETKLQVTDDNLGLLPPARRLFLPQIKIRH